MQRSFPLFQSHLDLAHSYWAKLVGPGDLVVDATCGNGQDTLVLAKLLKGQGRLIAYDIQPHAIENTEKLLKEKLQPWEWVGIELKLGSHLGLAEEYLRLVVYNLGYLPGGNKNMTTESQTTFNSIRHAMDRLLPDGAISITCYPGHPEGKKELDILSAFFHTLEKSKWSVTSHQWVNRHKSPILFLLQHARY